MFHVEKDIKLIFWYKSSIAQIKKPLKVIMISNHNTFSSIVVS